MFLDAVFIAKTTLLDRRVSSSCRCATSADGCHSAPVPHVEGWYIEPPARGLALARTHARGRNRGRSNAA